MTKIYLIFAVNIFLLATANAACEVDPAFAMPQTLTIAGQTITVRADAASDTATPIATFDSNRGNKTSFINCAIGEPYGKEVIGLTGQDTATKIYPTQIAGIGVKILWFNGDDFYDFPSASTVKTKIPGSDMGRLTYQSSSSFRLEFYKTAERLTLANRSGETLLPGGDIAYNWVTVNSLTNYAQKLTTGAFSIISTPVCTTESTKTVDFGTVTPALMRAGGVERALDFSLACRTDYGSWSAAASMITTSPSADARYIKVTDAANNTDSLGIEIYNSSGSLMAVNGTTTERSAATADNSAATFSWKAKLINTASGSTRPQNGNFNARAEIVLQIN